MRNDGTEMQRISFFGAYNQSPDWAFNITKAASASSSAPGKRNVSHPDDQPGRIRTRSSSPRATVSSIASTPVFSPDGRAIVMTTNSEPAGSCASLMLTEATPNS
jgi:Tol biopolymer transport system component